MRKGTCEVSAEAKAYAEKNGLMGKVYDAYRYHYYHSVNRKIEWGFTLKTWWAWWSKDGRWERRGNRANNLVMARHGDVGPYSPSNVYCCTQSQNRIDQNVKMQSERAKKWLAKRRVGDTYHRCKPVITDKGRFVSTLAASKAHGIPWKTATTRARMGIMGWRYE